MSDLTQREHDESEALLHSALAGGKLPRWAVPAVAVGALLVAMLLNVTTSVDGVAGTLIVAVLLFLVGQTAWSFTVEGRRHAVDRLATTGIYATFLIALAPLVAVLATVIVRGIGVISAEFLTTSMRNISPRSEGGGLYHALIGTLEQVGIAALISVPIGVLTAIYLVEYGKGRLAKSINFFVDVMTGIPSIVAGMFIFTFWILTLGFPTSGFAGALALSILMIPVVVRSSEEMLRIVPNELREGALALGVPKYTVIARIVVPTAISGLLTGVMLAVARVTGETAPLLLTTFLAQDTNWNPFSDPQASLPTFIWDQISRGTEPALNRAWGGALVLITIVLIFYAVARLLAVRYAPKSR